MVQALIHTTKSLRTSFRKHKVVVITDEPMEKILKLFGREGRLEKWVAEIRTYDISYIQRKEAEGSVVKKLFGQGEQVQKTPCAMKEKRPVASVNKGMKDLHVLIDSLTLVAQIEGNHTPATERERKYKEEIMHVTTPFYRGTKSNYN
nr:protein NYNRIN-like [Tanacetum cinerariifolium]